MKATYMSMIIRFTVITFGITIILVNVVYASGSDEVRVDRKGIEHFVSLGAILQPRTVRPKFLGVFYNESFFHNYQSLHITYVGRYVIKKQLTKRSAFQSEIIYFQEKYGDKIIYNEFNSSISYGMQNGILEVKNRSTHHKIGLAFKHLIGDPNKMLFLYGLRIAVRPLTTVRSKVLDTLETQIERFSYPAQGENFIESYGTQILADLGMQFPILGTRIKGLYFNISVIIGLKTFGRNDLPESFRRFLGFQKGLEFNLVKRL